MCIEGVGQVYRANADWLTAEDIEKQHLIPAGSVRSWGSGSVVTRVVRKKRDPNTGRGEFLPKRPMPVEVSAPLIERLQAANERWWGLDIDLWTFIVKRYGPTGEHPLHEDWGPRPWITKLSSSFQLSGPEDYEDGEFVMPMGPNKANVLMPKSEGTAIVFPCWTTHGVRPITSGERWVLLVNGWGPRLR